MVGITKEHTLAEVASIVSAALSKAGLEAVLTGGAAVSIYSNNQYESYDLDFITMRSAQELETVLTSLGFTRDQGHRHYIHPNSCFQLEFPKGPLAFGEAIFALDDTDTLKMSLGTIRIITPTQTIMDRLASYAHWKDIQSFRQALRVAADNEIDWDALYSWADAEGIAAAVIDEVKEDKDT